MDFEKQLDFGIYKISNSGILKDVADKKGKLTEEVIFPQKIFPTGIIHNITTENEKIKIDFLKGKEWRSISVEKNVTANKNKIIELANKGVAVNSLNSGDLVNYLSIMENLNYDSLPKYLETSQLGWYKDRFLPYAEDIQLCEIGGLNANTFKEHGTFEEWLKATNTVRQEHLNFRIMLASEFASPLLKLTGTLGAITHLWGATGTGKTVALMCGASVWGLPANDDGVIVTFNSTKVGFEILCDYLQNLPLNIDELETSNKANNDDIIYLITEGKGKIRGKASGGLSNIGKWKLWAISTGEHPITTDISKGGALNRIINLHTNESMVKNIGSINDLCSTWRNNYGFAGKMFIEYIKTLNRDLLISKYNDYLQEFLNMGGTGKQSMAGAMLMLADELANECIFKDDIRLKAKDFAGIILKEDEVSRAVRHHEMVFDWVASNERHFNGTENVDQWGKFEELTDKDKEKLPAIKGKDIVGKVCVIKTVLDTQFFKDINSKAILTEWKKKNYIQCDNNSLTSIIRIGKVTARVVCLYLLEDSTNELHPKLTLLEDDELPY